jgi:hypothetical protein
MATFFTWSFGWSVFFFIVIPVLIVFDFGGCPLFRASMRAHHKKKEEEPFEEQAVD